MLSTTVLDTIEVPEVGKYAAAVLGSDRFAYEIVRVVNERCADVRIMLSERDPSWKPEFVTGGFAGDCINQNSQRWICTPWLEAEPVRIRKHKSGNWHDASGVRYILTDKPVRFHDYNF